MGMNIDDLQKYLGCSQEDMAQWEQVDDTQFVRKIDENTFEIYDKMAYGENNKYSDIFFGEINIKDYTDENLGEEVKYYYKDLATVKEIYGEEWKQIVAEIIVENRY